MYQVGAKPPAEIERLARSVATDSELTGLIRMGTRFPVESLAYYGEIESRIAWGPYSGSIAVIRDCNDQSNFGTVNTKTRVALTVGSPRTNLNVTFRRVGQTWLVSGIYEPAGEPC